MAEQARAARLTFPRARRLQHAAEFAQVRTDGRVFRGELIMLGVLDTGSADPFRAGFVVSKRVGGAVVRNRVRRRLRELVRLHQREIATGIWLVLIARPAAARAEYGELKGEWLRLAGRASILRP